MVLATLLATIGLYVLLPHRHMKRRYYSGGNRCCGADCCGEDGESDSEGAIRVRENDDENNPVISVHIGGVSRYLHADNMESLDLDCSFGSLEVFFDQVTLSSDGAKAQIFCKFGSIEMYVPRQWRINDKITCSLGAVNFTGRRAEPEDDAPELTLSGSVSFGAVEIHYI